MENVKGFFFHAFSRLISQEELVNIPNNDSDSLFRDSNTDTDSDVLFKKRITDTDSDVQSINDNTDTDTIVRIKNYGYGTVDFSSLSPSFSPSPMLSPREPYNQNLEEEASAIFQEDPIAWMQQNKGYIIAGVTSISVMIIIGCAAYFPGRTISAADEEFIQRSVGALTRIPPDLFINVIDSWTDSEEYKQLSYLTKLSLDSLFEGAKVGFRVGRNYTCP